MLRISTGTVKGPTFVGGPSTVTSTAVSSLLKYEHSKMGTPVRVLFRELYY